jgi:hypothetical protein
MFSFSKVFVSQRSTHRWRRITFFRSDPLLTAINSAPLPTADFYPTLRSDPLRQHLRSDPIRYVIRSTKKKNTYHDLILKKSAAAFNFKNVNGTEKLTAWSVDPEEVILPECKLGFFFLTLRASFVWNDEQSSSLDHLHQKLNKKRNQSSIFGCVFWKRVSNLSNDINFVC